MRSSRLKLSPWFSTSFPAFSSECQELWGRGGLSKKRNLSLLKKSFAFWLQRSVLATLEQFICLGWIGGNFGKENQGGGDCLPLHFFPPPRGWSSRGWNCPIQAFSSSLPLSISIAPRGWGGGTKFLHFGDGYFFSGSSWNWIVFEYAKMGLLTVVLLFGFAHFQVDGKFRCHFSGFLSSLIWRKPWKRKQ